MCCKPKPKFIALANHSRRNDTINQSVRKGNTCSQGKARQNGGDKDFIGFGFTSDWPRKWHEILNQSSDPHTDISHVPCCPIAHAGNYKKFEN